MGMKENLDPGKVLVTKCITRLVSLFLDTGIRRIQSGQGLIGSFDEEMQFRSLDWSKHVT